ncbi:MAG: hypothetical protein WD716_03890 [Fimbriimonadaceae bacterium]
MSRKGREFEKLVRRVEAALSGADATVESPGYIGDVDTGQRRECDCTIKTRVGSVDILILVECREREETSDVVWIEQLMGKKWSVQANRVLAVTSNPVSKPAMLKAVRHNIEVRVLSDITDEEVASLCKVTKVETEVFSSAYSSCTVDLFIPGSPTKEQILELADWSRTVDAISAVLRIRETGKEVTTLDIWTQADRSAIRKAQPTPESREWSCQFSVIPADGQVLVTETPIGEVQVQRLTYHATGYMTDAPSILVSEKTYKGVDGRTFQVVEHEAMVAGLPQRTTFVYDVETREATSAGDYTWPIDIELIKQPRDEGE